jgi:hypothetical protein
MVIFVFVSGLYPYELSRFVFTRDVKNNEPADSDTIFFLVEDSMYCFTEFRNIKRTTQIIHKWFCQGRQIGLVKLVLQRSRRWRTWSRKLFKNCTGEWKVQVCDLQGKVLAEKKFLVKKM